MYGNATIKNNIIFGSWSRSGGGVNLSEDSILTMRQDALIYGNRGGLAGGISAWSGHVYMFDNAAIRNNFGSTGGLLIWTNSTLNMHGNDVQISGNSAHDNGGGLVVMGLGTTRFHISGGTIYGANAPLPHLRNMARVNGNALYVGSSSEIRVGSFCSEGGFVPCGINTFTIRSFNNTFKVVDGELK